MGKEKMMKTGKKYFAIVIVILCVFILGENIPFATMQAVSTKLDEDDIRWRDYEYPRVIAKAKYVFENQNGDYKKMTLQLINLTDMYESYLIDDVRIHTDAVTKGFHFYLAEYWKNLLPRYLKNMSDYRAIVKKKYKSDKAKFKAYSKIAKKIDAELIVWKYLKKGMKDSNQIDRISKSSCGLAYKCCLFYQEYKHRKYIFIRYGVYKNQHKKGLFTKHGTMIRFLKINKKRYRYVDPVLGSFFHGKPINTKAVWIKRK